MSSSWAPNETAYQIYEEKVALQANILENIPYGVELALFVACFFSLVQNMKPSNAKRQIFLLTYITIIFGLGTIFMITNSLITQQAFVEYRDYPGGPASYLNAMFANTVGLTNSVSWVVSNWLLDVFLVWRFVVIYSDVRRSWFRVLFAIPCLMLLSTIILGCIVLSDMAKAVDSSDSSPYVEANLTLSYYAISLALNIILTILIAARLLVHRHHIALRLGSHHATSYANTAAIIVESAGLYAVFGFTFLVLFGIDNPVYNVFLNLVMSLQAIAAFLIILRLTKGRAWSEDTCARIYNSTENILLGSRAVTNAGVTHDGASDIKEPALDGDNTSGRRSGDVDQKA